MHDLRFFHILTLNGVIQTAGKKLKMIPMGTERKVLLSLSFNFIIPTWFHRVCYLNELIRQIESDKIIGKLFSVPLIVFQLDSSSIK